MNATLEPPVTTETPHSSEHAFTSADGTELFYRAWSAPGPLTRAVVLFHRGHEHSGRWDELARALVAPGTAVFAWDARGHGRSPGDRGWAPDFATLVRDADAFVRHLSAAHGVPVSDMAVVAHSVGAVIAAAWVHDHAPPVRALVLATPALRVKLYVPLAIPSLRALMKVRRRAFVKSYVRSNMLTHDPAQAAAYDADPLISKQIAVNILLDLHDASGRLIADAGAIAAPTLVLCAGSDWVVRNGAAARFYERLSSPVKAMHTYPGMGHAIFHETGRAEVFDRVKAFIDRQFAPGPGPAEAGEPAGRVSFDAVVDYTRREFEKLSAPRPLWCPKGWSFRAQRAAMKTVLRLSDGIRLGWRTGFDSGQSLDYVYRNRSRGRTPLGGMIDHFYLNAIGWRGIRVRREHLSRALREAIAAAAARDGAARVLDVAAGPGRYVLEALAASPAGADVSAVCRDRSESALAAGRQLAAELGVSAVRFETGDAFSRDELASLTPRPNVAVVSGLYELFPENPPVEQSLAGLAAALPPGGTLIYTNQPWHPQVEMIARTLDNRDGQPWVMRRHTQLEMDELVRRAGFIKERMDIDPWGIFTVSVARRAEG